MSCTVKAFPDGYVLPVDDDKLMAECVVTVFRAHGKGGQHVNKTDSAVRLRHQLSGVTVTCQKERSQYRNKAVCLERLRGRLEQLLHTDPPRVVTKVPIVVKVRRRDGKILQSKKKAMRKVIVSDD